jgi:hypothetical protein
MILQPQRDLYSFTRGTAVILPLQTAQPSCLLLVARSICQPNVWYVPPLETQPDVCIEALQSTVEC